MTLPHRILIVDDDLRQLRLLKSILTARRCRVRMAASGRAAERVLRNLPFDLVVLDFKLPDMTGDRLIEITRSVTPQTAILLVSGSSRDEIGACLTDQSVSFLPKPFSIEAFQAAAEAALLEGMVARRT